MRGISIRIDPLQARILVKRFEEEATTTGGIIIPDTAKEKPQEGRSSRSARESRDDGKLWKLEVRKGDRVLFGKFARTEATLAGTEHLIIREDDVLRILK